eukprot:CAMPEP_0179484852 /NCGR_PEP_ID=MMETSP0799-20121207/61650_1 /TAXON_ID=46947 /ORGANISM="Geminigera cryophila, Strain CCMP2564" /LENGTH=35 /DNA_ID= /DNA_START= /DNA_END= /DNA_ORIENTATION=
MRRVLPDVNKIGRQISLAGTCQPSAFWVTVRFQIG